MGEQVAAGEFGGLAQLGERLPCKQEVTSSTLVFSTTAQVLLHRKTYDEGHVLFAMYFEN